jgi:orotidine-5'-phosphate decarboxylase
LEAVREHSFAEARDRLAVGLDVPRLDEAERLLEVLGDLPGWIKVGAELFTAAGPAALRAAARRSRVFLDTKLHDIPNSVAGAVRAAVGHGVAMLTLHACGGEAMLRAAREAADEAAARVGRPRPLLIGVTVLTSLDDASLTATGVQGGVAAQVARLVEAACETGLDGVVASAREVAAIRALTGSRLRIVTPGIRPPGWSTDDQSRVTTPEIAVRAGADLLVVARPIVRAADPRAAAASCLEAIGKALALPSAP